jgi:hypothetical protein
LSSEGRNSPVLEVTVPDRVVAAMAGASLSAAPSPTPPAAEPQGVRDQQAGDAGGHWLLALAIGAGGAGLLLLVVLLVPRRRSRSRR